MKKKQTEVVDVTDLVFDDMNPNRGTQRGMSMLEESLRTYGAGRSILLDKDNRIMAGNKTAEVAHDIGIDRVRVVETDGTELVAFRRVDLDLNEDPRARELGVADNRVGQVNMDWEPEILAALQDRGVKLEGLWLDHELDKLLRSTTIDATLAKEEEEEEAAAAASPNSGVGHVRMVQLFLDGEQAKRFEQIVEDLGKVFKIETTTDTVWEALKIADRTIEGKESVQ
jgi:hypothetical protein